MCTNPKMIINQKYKPTQKNEYGKTMEKLEDRRKMYITVPCNRCEECRKSKASGWMVRIKEEMKNEVNGYFVTLTFSDRALRLLKNQYIIKNKNKKDETGFKKYNEITLKEKSENEHEIVKLAVHLFRERWRKKYKTSIRHWLVTEHGHNGTERIHLHGILWQNEAYIPGTRKRNAAQRKNDEFSRIWAYGWVFTGEYCNENTAGYCVKYVTKKDEKHPEYYPIILTSPGIGRNMVKRDVQIESIRRNYTITNKAELRLENGLKIAVPRYFKNKIWEETEREKMFNNYLDEAKWIINETEFINTEEDNIKLYIQTLKNKQESTTSGRWVQKWNDKQFEERAVLTYTYGKEPPTDLLKNNNFENLENFEKK